MKVCALDGCSVAFRPVTCQKYCCPEHREQGRRCTICKSARPESLSPHCRRCDAMVARIRRTDPEFKARAIGRHRFKMYGITEDQYLQMVEAQNGLCAICGQPESSTRRGVVKTLSVDHDHATGAIRGLLCHGCNTAIGLLGDDPSRLQAAIDYLSR